MNLCTNCGLTVRSRKRAKCKPCLAKKMREWRASNPDKWKPIIRKAMLKYELKEYGLTPEEYWQMSERQNGVCAICKLKDSKWNRRLAVDHDHSTSKVRGLLCTACNTSLGRLGDTKESIQRVLQYLQKYETASFIQFI